MNVTLVFVLFSGIQVLRLLVITQLAEGGAAGLQPGLPDDVPQGELVLHGLHAPLVSLHRFLHSSQDCVVLRLGVGPQGRGLRRVPGQVVQQRRVVAGDVGRLTEADVRVVAGRLVLWVEVGGEVKGFPDGVAWNRQIITSK